LVELGKLESFCDDYFKEYNKNNSKKYIKKEIVKVPNKNNLKLR